MQERQIAVTPEDIVKLFRTNPIEEIYTPLGEARLKIIILDRLLNEKEKVEPEESSNNGVAPVEEHADTSV